MMMAAQINLSWLELFNLINGVGGWKLCLNLKFSYSNNWPEKWGEGGAAVWHSNNIELHVWGVEKRTSLIWISQNDYKSTDIDLEASQTWKKLKELVSPFSKKQNRKYGPHHETLDNIEDLRKIRSDALKEGREIPSRAWAIERAGIDRNTWKRIDKVFYDMWYIKSYKQKN